MSAWICINARAQRSKSLVLYFIEEHLMVIFQPLNVDKVR